MFNSKNLKAKLIVTLAVIIYAVVCYAFGIPCIILRLTGLPCLGCGMTRAIISVLKLDFRSAFSYHSMVWSLPLLYLMFLTDGKLLKQKSLNITCCVILAAGFLAELCRKLFVLL